MEDYIEPYLYHGIKFGGINKLIEIIESGFILPKKMIPGFKKENKTGLDLNGESWISLSQKSLFDPYYGEETCSYELRIYQKPCFVIRNFIEGIRYTNYLNIDEISVETIQSMIKDDSKTRYSTYVDEVQTNVPISMKEVIAIGIPEELSTEQNVERVKRTLEKAKMNVPILDSSKYNFADNEECMKKSKIL